MIALVPTGPEHVEPIQRLAGHPDIAAMTPIPHPYPEDGAARFVRNVVLPGRAAGTFYGFVIEAGDEVVGHVGLKNVDRTRGEAELGYWVGRPYWGRGYASEAARLALDVAFGALGLEEVYAHVLARNPASARVLEKAGFERVALPPEKMPDACATRGETWGFQIGRAAWERLRTAPAA